MTRKTARKTLKIMLNLFSFTLGLLLFSWIIRSSGQSFVSLVKETVKIKHYLLLLTMGTYFFQSFLMAKRWGLLLNLYTEVHHFPKGFLFYNTNLGLLTSSFLPVLGYVGAKTASCKFEQDMDVPKTVYASSVELMIGMSVMVILLLPSLLYMLNIIGLAAGILGMGVVAAVLYVVFNKFYRASLKILSSILSFFFDRLNRLPFLKKRSDRVFFHPYSFTDVDKTAASKLISLSLLIYLIILVRYLIFLTAFNIPLDGFKFALLYPLGYAIASLGITPGNLGFAEMGWFGILRFSGINHQNAALYAVGYRILDIGAIILLYIVGYLNQLWYRSGKHEELPK